MLEPPLPLDETARLLSLQSLHILDTEPEKRFDRITRMAQRSFGVEICLVSLVDSNRQWFKSRQGLDACETTRDISFCGHAILNEEVLVVEDAANDDRFHDNPLVTSEPNIRFYAGCPLHGPLGHRIGTLCLIDSAPRGLSAEDIEMLRDYAHLVENELGLVAQAAVDELTGLTNRRGFHTVAEHMLSLCRRTDTPAELLFFDLDGLKEVNDQCGHEIGDALIRDFATALVKCFRTADVVGRIGGDEFVVLMAGSDLGSESALVRLKVRAEQESVPCVQPLKWSVGRVVYDSKRHDTIEGLIADADARMYENKLARRRHRA